MNILGVSVTNSCELINGLRPLVVYQGQKFDALRSQEVARGLDASEVHTLLLSYTLADFHCVKGVSEIFQRFFSSLDSDLKCLHDDDPPFSCLKLLTSVLNSSINCSTERNR